MTTVHASAVAIGGRGVLVVGPPGSGKSDLVLRLLDRGAMLIGDDLVDVSSNRGRLFAEAPAIANGRLDVADIDVARIDVARIGLVTWPDVVTAAVPLAIVVELATDTRRTPVIDRYGPIASLYLPQVTLDAAHASTGIKVELALERWGL